MKKILIIAIALILSAGTIEAQKRNTANMPKASSRNAQPLSSASANGETSSQVVAEPLKVIDSRQLPPVEVGLDRAFRETLMQRATIRQISEEILPDEIISSLLWSAYGINRPDESKRVVPSACNVQEYDIYLFTNEGIYLYNAQKNSIELVVKGDYRAEISTQKHFSVAPVSIVLVANYDRMKRFKETADRDFYAAVDAGYISQNIYLFCSSADLATVACGAIEREKLAKLLHISNGRVMLAHPVGMMAK